MVNPTELPTNAGFRDVVTETDQRLTQLHRAHANALKVFLSRWTLDDRAATDQLVRETFLRASRTLGQRDLDPATLRQWLFTLANRVAIEFRRSQQRRLADSGGRGQGQATRGRGLTDQLPDGRVALASQQLRPEYRRVIVELYSRGRTVQEAAELLAIPESTVASHAYHALRALRSAMQTTTGATPGAARAPAR